MKKLFIAALALIGMSSSAYAIDFEPESGVSFQATLGMTTSKISNLDDYQGKVGGTAGFKAEFMLPNAHGTYINAGLDWTMKGAKHTETDVPFGANGIHDVTSKIRTHYLQIPIHVGFRYNIMEDLGVYGELGPYFGVGIGGKFTEEIDANGTWTKPLENSYAIFKKSKTQENLQRWDAGVGFRIGAEYMEHYSLNLGCDWGVTDMWRDDFKDAMHDAGVDLNKIKNFSFTIAFGYRF